MRLALVLAFTASCDDERPSAPAEPNVASTPAPQPAGSSPRPMLIDFTRDYCLPCQVMAPWVAQLRTDYRGTVDVVEVNIDRGDNERLGHFFTIKSVPTQVFVDASGHVEARHEGLASKEEMTATLSRLGWIARR